MIDYIVGWTGKSKHIPRGGSDKPLLYCVKTACIHEVPKTSNNKSMRFYLFNVSKPI